MIQPHDIQLKRADGSTVVLIVTKLPAIPAREIVTQYVTSALPRIGDYKHNEKLMRKLLAYASVRLEDGTTIPLSTDASINNHLVDWETLVQAEWRMLEYNTSFLKKLDGVGSWEKLGMLLKTKIPALKQALQNMRSSSLKKE